MITEKPPRERALRIPGPYPHLLVVRAPYYRAVVEVLTEGAISVLGTAGATHGILDVFGAFELPQVIRLALRGRRHFDGYIALGCVVRGETDNYDFLCGATMQGIMDVSIRYGIALGNGLLTVDTLAQAEARSAADEHNKGAEAAEAVLGQISATRRLGSW